MIAPTFEARNAANVIRNNPIDGPRKIERRMVVYDECPEPRATLSMDEMVGIIKRL
jgi:hypothetical protein